MSLFKKLLGSKSTPAKISKQRMDLAVHDREDRKENQKWNGNSAYTLRGQKVGQKESTLISFADFISE